MRPGAPSCRRGFTLIELLIAVMILALALSATLLYVSNAQRDLAVSREEWDDTHALATATEYFLLDDPARPELPAGLLAEGYTAQCKVVDVQDRLPEGAQDAKQGWQLKGYEISLYRGHGEPVAHHTIYKLAYVGSGLVP
jgi:prepilin-type N-terminal cleavage/methylation domain-containing protein